MPLPRVNRSKTPARALLLAAALLAACQTSIDEDLARARSLQAEGRVSESMVVLRQVLEADPQQPEANRMMGATFLQAGRPAQAIQRLRVAFLSEQEAVPAGLLLASAFVAREDYEQAVATADRILEIDGQQAAALRIRANANLHADRPDASLADCDRLLELRPGDTQAGTMRAQALAALGRPDEAEAAFTDLMEAAEENGEAAVAANACVLLAGFHADTRKDARRAEATYRLCLERHSDDPRVIQSAVGFYDRGGRSGEADRALRRVLEQHPDDLSVRVRLATRLRGQGRHEEGERLLLEGIERNDSSQAWQALARYRRNAGDLPGAAEAADQALQRAPEGDDGAVLLKADILVDQGRLDEAEALAASLQRPAYRNVVMGRVLLQRGDAAGALVALEAALRMWPRNGAAHFLAGRAAAESGDLDRALAGYTQATRIAPNQTDGALFAARIFYSRGDWEQAAYYAVRHANQRPTASREAHILASRAHSELGNREAARLALTTWIDRNGMDGPIALEMASLELREGGPDAAARSLDQSGLDLTDPAHAQLLRAWCQYAVAAGRGAEALARVDRAVAAHPDAAALHAVRGRVLLTTGETGAAENAFDRALALDPDQPMALTGLGSILGAGTDVSRGVELLDRAAELAPADPEPAYVAARSLLTAGHRAEGETRLRSLLERFPGYPAAANDLAWLLAEDQRDLDLALDLANTAARGAEGPALLDTLGFVHLRRGEPQEAARYLRQAVTEAPGQPSVQYRLGLALAAGGDPAGAAEAFRSALATGPFPEEDDARQQLAGLEGAGTP